MATSTILYKGELRSEAIHLESGNRILTDAPKDNFGKGEAFSPTDLVATALGLCMISVMGIVSRREGITPVDGATAEVTKVMYADPRRIGEIHVSLKFPAKEFTDKEKKMYENAAYTCPVARSLHPDIRQIFTFLWP